MASILVRPSVIDFIDLAMYARDFGLQLEEMRVPDHAPFTGKELQDSGLRQKYNLIVVAIKRDGEEMRFNPGPKNTIRPGDTLIVLGQLEQISRLKNTL
jgi:voltage-gated potassium channel